MSDDLLARGRRNLICGEITKAVEDFQEACSLLAAKYGDTDKNLAEPNLLYGTALLELARMESTVIGNALQGVPDDENGSDVDDSDLIEETNQTEEEKNKLSDDVIDAMCVSEPEEADNGENESPKDKDENVDVPAAADEATTDVPETTERRLHDAVEDTDETAEDAGDDEDGSDHAEDEAQKSDEGSEITNLQIAWEVIEVAKSIYSNDGDESQLKVAECFSRLAEISREKEDYDSALSDLNECLSIRVKLLPNDHRDVAEAHYQLGTTYLVAGDFDNASQSFKCTIDCLRLRAANLSAKLKDLGDGGERLSTQAALTEVEGLIKDVESRCTEVEEDKSASKLVPSAILIGENTTEVTSMNGTSKQVDDISHLVRRKRVVSNGTEVENDGATATGADDHSSPKIKKLKTGVSNSFAANASSETKELPPDGV